MEKSLPQDTPDSTNVKALPSGIEALTEPLTGDLALNHLLELWGSPHLLNSICAEESLTVERFLSHVHNPEPIDFPFKRYLQLEDKRDETHYGKYSMVPDDGESLSDTWTFKDDVKKCQSSYISATLDTNIAGEPRRNTSSARGVSVIFIDIDDTERGCDVFADIRAALPDIHFRVHTTMSNGVNPAKGPRVRLGIPTDGTVPLAELPAAVYTVAALLKTKVDPCSKTCVQAMLKPVCFEYEYDGASVPGTDDEEENPQGYGYHAWDTTKDKSNTTQDRHLFSKADISEEGRDRACAFVDTEEGEPSSEYNQQSAADRYSEEEIRASFKYLQDNNLIYDDWMKVCFAFKHHFRDFEDDNSDTPNDNNNNTDDVARTLFLEFSALTEKPVNEGLPEQKWDNYSKPLAEGRPSANLYTYYNIIREHGRKLPIPGTGGLLKAFDRGDHQYEMLKSRIESMECPDAFFVEGGLKDAISSRKYISHVKRMDLGKVASDKLRVLKFSAKVDEVRKSITYKEAKPTSQASDTTKTGTFYGNCKLDSEEELQPLQPEVMARDLKSAVGDWPRLLGTALFGNLLGKDDIYTMGDDSCDAFDGWLSHRTKMIPQWMASPGFMRARAFMKYIKLDMVDEHKYESIRRAPQYPPRDDAYYLHGKLPEADPQATAFHEFCDLFHFPQEMDLDGKPRGINFGKLAFKAYVLSLFYGKIGKPLFIWHSKVARDGKTKKATIPLKLLSENKRHSSERGVITIGPHLVRGRDQDEERAKKLVLTTDSRKKTAVLVDNANGHTDSEILANMTTDEILNGLAPFGKDTAHRVNDLVFSLTGINVTLSNELAQRSVPVFVHREENLSNGIESFERVTNDFMDIHRKQIVADAIGILENGVEFPTLTKFRFSDWMHDVVAPICADGEEFAAFEKELTRRQEAIDKGTDVLKGIHTEIENYLTARGVPADIPIYIEKKIFRRLVGQAQQLEKIPAKNSIIMRDVNLALSKPGLDNKFGGDEISRYPSPGSAREKVLPGLTSSPRGVMWNETAFALEHADNDTPKEYCAAIIYELEGVEYINYPKTPSKKEALTTRRIEEETEAEA